MKSVAWKIVQQVDLWNHKATQAKLKPPHVITSKNTVFVKLIILVCPIIPLWKLPYKFPVLVRSSNHEIFFFLSETLQHLFLLNIMTEPKLEAFFSPFLSSTFGLLVSALQCRATGETSVLMRSRGHGGASRECASTCPSA